MADWVFDSVPPSGAVQGGSAFLHTLGTGIGIDTFVREVIQNSYDQTEPGNRCDVQFSLHRLDGEDKKLLFDAIGFESLKSHLRGLSGLATETSLMNTRLRQGLDSVLGEPVTILRIDDSGTRGLSGSEDDPLGNFNALCRNQLVTSEDKPSRGGSYGLGKAVLWAFSSISTVMFSSRIAIDGGSRFRLFGRAELAHHATDSGQWSGQGWFGEKQHTDRGDRAISLWDHAADSTARRASLFRPAQLGNGTTILVLGFREPDQEQDRSVVDIASDITRSTARWFWPGIHYADQRLNVTVQAYEQGIQVYSETVDSLKEISPFISVMADTAGGSVARDPGEIGTVSIDLKIPGRKLPPEDLETHSRLILKLRRSSEGDSMDLANRVALVRGNSGMVVAYKHLRPPVDGTSFHAVLLAGEAAGSLEEDYRLDRFLRACEPPSHNDWLPGTERVRAEYQRGSGARIQRLWKDLDTATSRLCEGTPASLTAGPRRLAEMFPLRRGPSRSPALQKFRTDDLEASFIDGIWRFSGRVTRVIPDQRDWGFSLSFTLDVETGNGTAIDISDIQVSSGSTQIDGSRCLCRVRNNTEQIEFEGSAHPHPGLNGPGYMARTRARLSVRPYHMVPAR